MRHLYALAGRTIEITALNDTVYRYCVDYQTDGIPDYTVTIEQTDIEVERVKAEREDRAEGKTIQRYPDAYLETLAVYRKIAEKMPEYDTLLFHGSCVAVDGAAYLFTAKSGTGKSTHTRLWRELLGDRAVMVNDDKPLIRITGEGAVVYGTPWNGKHRLSSNISVPMQAVCILGRAEENRIRQITPAEALPMLLQQVYRPVNPDAMAKTLKMIDLLAGSVKLFRLDCNMSPEAAEIAYRAMKG